MRKILSLFLAAAMLFSLCVFASADEGVIEAGSWDELRSAVNGATVGVRCSIRLTQDVVCPEPDNTYHASSISVGQGRDIVLDLNGHTLDRGLYRSDGTSLAPLTYGSVIRIFEKATLTVRDSSAGSNGVGTGKITGGCGYNAAGGVMVMPGATFILESGVIEGNRGTHQCGGGVHVQHGSISTLGTGVFVMKGGLIQNNIADDNGGGVNVGGTFFMRGGTIAANAAAKHGGGVWVDDSGIMLLGSEEDRGADITVNITGNTAGGAAENLYLCEGSPLGVIAGLSAGSAIGVTTGKAPRADLPSMVTNVPVSGSDGEDRTDCFTSDDENCGIGRSKEGSVVLGVPVRLSFSAGAGSLNPSADGGLAPLDELGGVPFLLPDPIPEPESPEDPANSFIARTGQGFDCWLINGKRYEAGEEITLTADATATALYGNAVTLTIKDGKDDTYTRTQFAIAGKTVVLPMPEDCFEELLADGGAFRGWTIGGEDTIRDPGEAFVVAGDTEITAQWEEAMTWTQLRTRLSQAKNGETIRLYNDVIRDWRNEEDGPLVPSRIARTYGYPVQTTLGTVTLDLNGHRLDRCMERGSYGYVIETSSVHLIITDTSAAGTGVITGSQYDEYGTGQSGGIFVGDESTVTLRGGSITGNRGRYGGGVMVWGTNAKFNMEGGSIDNNIAVKEGGAVYLYEGVMTMTGGVITGNRAQNTAGAIMASAETRLRLFGGSIYGNRASSCGSIRIDGEALFFVQGAPELLCELDSVNENRCDVYLESGSRIQVTDVLLNDNPIDVILEDHWGVLTGKLNDFATAKNFAAAEEGYMTAMGPDDRAVIGDMIEVSFDPNGAKGAKDPEQVVRGSLYTLPDLDRYEVVGAFFGTTNGIVWPDDMSFNGWLLPGEEEPRTAGSKVSFSEPTTLTACWADNWGMLQSRINAGESSITLSGNVTANRSEYGGRTSDPLVIPAGADVVLDLAGFDIDRRTKDYEFLTDDGYCFLVQGRLTVRDSSEEHSGRITGADGRQGGAIHVAPGGELILEGGSITDNIAQFGGGVYVEDGSFTMTGGYISGNSCEMELDAGPSGGAVYVCGTGVFTMTGGFISYNSAADKGGGVCLVEEASMTLGGAATIMENSAVFGGGVYVGGSADITILDGEICYNEVSGWSYGGGVYIQQGCTGVMSGGIIHANRGGYGAGVRTDGSFTMSGGSIVENNSDSFGGGVYVRGSFTVSGSARVTDNNWNGKPCNVYLIEDRLVQIADVFTGILGVTSRVAPTTETPVRLTEGYGATGSTGSVVVDSEDYLIGLIETGDGGSDIFMGAPVILRFDPGPGTGSMPWEQHFGGMPFTMPGCDFYGPDGGAFKEWLINGAAYPAGASCTLTADAVAIAAYEGYTPETPIDNWPALASALADGGYVRLEADISGRDGGNGLPDLIISSDTTLDLAGHVLTCKADEPIMIGDPGQISSMPFLTVVDSVPYAVHENLPQQQGGVIIGCVELADSSSFTLDGGAILSDREAGVRVGSYAEFTMQGGRILSLDSAAGGIGVSVEAGGSFTLSAGYVCGFTTGVRNTNGTVALEGGSVTENAAGVENRQSGVLTMTGGVIAAEDGPGSSVGVWNFGDGVFVMSGGVIRDVGVSVDNGGVYQEAGAAPLSGAAFTMSGGTIRDAGGVLVHGDGALFTMTNGTITGMLSGDASSAAVNVSDGGELSLLGGELLDTGITGVFVGADSSFDMAGGDIQANAETAVSVENGFFRMSGGRITGNAVGVAVSRLDTVSGGFVLSGGTISGCGEAGVSVSEKGAFIMLGGEVQGNPDAVGVALNGGNFDMAGGTITGNGLGVSVRNGSFSQYDGEVTRNTDCDVDVFSPVEGEETGPRFGIVGSAETGSVRLAAGAVIHIDDVLDPDMKTITVNTGSGLGSVITEGLPLRGDVSLFACEGDQYVIGLSDGEAALAYGVFFNTDGGTQIAPQYILTAGQKAQMPEQIPLLNRALFVAWYLGDSEFDFDSVITGSVTLRAAWERVELGAADFRLPAALTVIEEEAFSGLSGKTVVLPAVPAGEGSADSVIRANAFADCTDLVVLVPAGWQIEPGAFAGCEGVLLCGPEGGAAHVYAEASPESCIFCLYS